MATSLEHFGWNESWNAQFTVHRAAGWVPGRVAVEDKHHYEVLTPNGLVLAQIPGKFFHQAGAASDLPKVGDWVAIELLPETGRAMIRALLPRQSQLTRKLPGRTTERQILAANIDVAFAIQALDESFNLRRLERFLIMVHESGARPVAVLNKSDLCTDLDARIEEVRTIAGDVPIVAASARTGKGLGELRKLTVPGQTVVFLGPSGVGKSSLINRLFGEKIQDTVEVRDSDAKGRHTTTWRELIPLPSGAVVIDTPGMREFHLLSADDGLADTFADIEAMSVNCRFRDCRHQDEKDCAVKAAVERGEISKDRHLSHTKLQKELEKVGAAEQKRKWIERRRQTNAAKSAFHRSKPTEQTHDD